MSCPRPYVNPPECDVSYLKDNPYAYAPFILGLAVWTTTVCFVWASLEHLISSGSIRLTLDYFQYILLVLVTTLLGPWATNPSVLMSGKLSDAASTLGFMLGATAFLIIPVLSVLNNRRLYCRLYLHKRMQGKEIVAYMAIVVVFVASGLVSFILYLLYILGEVTQYSFGVTFGVCTIVIGVFMCTLSVAWLSFLHHLRITGQHEALKVIDSSKLGWIGVFVIGVVATVYSTVNGMFTNPKENVDQSTMPDSAVDQHREFFSKCAIVIFAGGWAFPSLFKSYSRRLIDQWGVQQLPAAAMVKSCVCISVVFLGSVAIPQLLPFETMELFLDFLFPFACVGITTLLVWKSAHEEEFLEDWCVAGLLVSKEDENKYGKALASIQFYGAWMINLGSTASIVFSLSASPNIPWLNDTGMQKMDMYEVFNLNLDKMQFLQSLAFLIILVSLLTNILFEFTLHLSPSDHSFWRRQVMKITSFLSFMFYGPALLPALRILKTGIQCSPDPTGVKNVEIMNAIPGIECEEKDEHHLLVQIVMACVTWFLGVKALIYSHQNKFIFKPRLTMDPRGATITTFFIIFSLGLKPFASLNDWMATFLGVGIAILIFVFEYKYPNLIGLPKAKAIQLSVMACTLEIHAASLLNFIWPQRWVPFIIMLVFFPVTAVSVYVLRLRGHNNEKIDNRVRALHVCDFKSEEARLDARDLGALLHTRDFYNYLLAVLHSTHQSKGLNGSKKSDQGTEQPLSEHAAHESETIVRALDLISSALSFECGRRALAFDPDLVRAASPFLSFPDTKVAANTAICAMSSVDSLAPNLCTHALKLLLDEWATVKSMSFHTQASHTIRTIKGGDKIILYMCSSVDMNVTPLHSLLRGRVVSVKTGRMQVWLVPYDAHASSHSFVPSDPIDGVLIFPPDLPIPFHLLRDALVDCPRLCIPSKPDFVDFYSVATKNTNVSPPADDDRRPSFLRSHPSRLRLPHRNLQTPVRKPGPGISKVMRREKRKKRHLTQSGGSFLRSLSMLSNAHPPSSTIKRPDGSARWGVSVPSLAGSQIPTSTVGDVQHLGNRPVPPMIPISAPADCGPADSPAQHMYNHLFVLGFMAPPEKDAREEPLNKLIQDLSLYYAGKLLAWSPNEDGEKTSEKASTIAPARPIFGCIGKRAKKLFRRTLQSQNQPPTYTGVEASSISGKRNNLSQTAICVYGMGVTNDQI